MIEMRHIQVWRNLERDTIEVQVSIPFRDYAADLFPNEKILREVEEAMRKFMDHNRR